MASENVTTKFKVDISDLKANISEANRQVKLYRAEMQNASAGMKKGEESADSLTKKIEAQSKIVDAEKQKLEALKQELERYQQRIEQGKTVVAELTDKHQKAAEAFGKDSEEAQKLAEQLKKATDAQERNETAADKLRVQIVNQDTAVKNAEGNVRDFTAQLDSLQTEEKKVGDEAKKTSDGGLNAFSVALGNLVSNVITGAIDKLKELAQSAYDAYNAFDVGRDNLIKATGATGEAADALTETYKNVSKQVAADMGSIGSAVGEVNTRFGYTGEELERASVAFLKFSDITGTDATRAVQLVSRAMGDAGVNADDYASVLDQMAVAAQASGIKLEKLAEYTTKYGAPMRALGFDMQESIALFSQWEKSGVNTEIAFSGMKTAISNWSKEGKDAKSEFSRTLEEISKAPDIAQATTKAIEVFGKKAGPDLADAIQGGRFEYSEFLDIVQNSSGTVVSTFDETQSVLDRTNVTLQELKVTAAESFAVLLEEVAPIIEELLPAITEFVQTTGQRVKQFFEDVNQNGGGLQGAVVVITEKIPDIQYFLEWLNENGPAIASVCAAIASAILAFQAVTAIQSAAIAFKAFAAAVDLAAAKQWLLNVALNANPVGIIIAAVAGLVAYLVMLYNTSDEFREKVDLWGESVLDTFEAIGKVLSDFWDNLKSGWKMISDGWNDFWDNFYQKSGDIFDSVASGFRDFINGIIRGINKIPGIEIPEIGGGDTPALARGGIVNRPTTALIGENGTEAVVPLENNLGGLRGIASALAAEMGRTESAQPVTNINYTQNISSPKPLSTYEIWRQSQNALRNFKKWRR